MGLGISFCYGSGVALIIAALIVTVLKPINKHLGLQRDKSAFKHLWHTVSKQNYRVGFAATAALSIGGFMMMPFGSVFAVNNLHVTAEELPLLFMISGVSSLVIMPLIGRLSDTVSKFKIFSIASIWTMIICVAYTNLSATPFWIVIGLNVLMMIGIMSRMVPSSALTSAIPDMEDRGAFMSINSSMQQIAGGIAAAVSGMIVVQKTKFSPIEHYDTVGFVVVAVTLISIFLMYRVNQLAKKKPAQAPLVEKPELVTAEF
ncbi:MFS transporter [Pedobacter sp. NJ-S-72]